MLSDAMDATHHHGQATGTIENPNASPQISITGGTVTASSGGPTAATFSVSLTAPSSLPVTVDYETSDGDAHGGFDYVAVPLSPLTFDAGQTTQTFTVTINAAPLDGMMKSFNLEPFQPFPRHHPVGPGQRHHSPPDAGNRHRSREMPPGTLRDRPPGFDLRRTTVSATTGDRPTRLSRSPFRDPSTSR